MKLTDEQERFLAEALRLAPRPKDHFDRYTAAHRADIRPVAESVRSALEDKRLIRRWRHPFFDTSHQYVLTPDGRVEAERIVRAAGGYKYGPATPAPAVAAVPSARPSKLWAALHNPYVVTIICGVIVAMISLWLAAKFKGR